MTKGRHTTWYFRRAKGLGCCASAWHFIPLFVCSRLLFSHYYSPYILHTGAGYTRLWLMGWRLWEGGGNGFLWSSTNLHRFLHLQWFLGSLPFSRLFYYLVSVSALRHFTRLSSAQMDELLFPKCLGTDNELRRGFLVYWEYYFKFPRRMCTYSYVLAMIWKHDCHLR